MLERSESDKSQKNIDEINFTLLVTLSAVFVFVFVDVVFPAVASFPVGLVDSFAADLQRA